MKKKHCTPLNTDPEPRYRYREILCPLCDHRFMAEMNSLCRYKILGDNTEYVGADCPHCGERLLVEPGVLGGGFWLIFRMINGKCGWC